MTGARLAMLMIGLTASALLAACSPDLRVSNGLVVTCGTDGVCPDGLVCVAGERCLASELIDVLGPSRVSPAPNAVILAREPVLFAWQSVAAAASYTLSVAADEAFTNLVGGTPVAIADTSTTLSLPAGTYHWRVTADVTQTDSVDSARFAVIGDAVHVYCAAGADCGEAGDDELGSVELPYRSIVRAIDGASGLNVARVAVADRGDAAYDEAITVRSGIDLMGGYEPTFVTNTGRTRVARDAATLLAVGIAGPTRIERFAFAHTGAGESGSTVARIVECSRELVVADVTFGVDALTTNVIEVQASSDSDGPLLVDVVLSGTSGASELATDLALLSVTRNGSVRVEDGHFSGEATPAKDLAAIAVDNSYLSLTGGDIVVSNCTSCAGVITQGILNSAYRVAIAGTTIAVGNSIGRSVGVSVSAVQQVVIERATISVADGTNTFGLRTSNVGDLRVTSSVVAVSDANSEATGMELTNVLATLVNNTIAVFDGGLGQRGVALEDSSQAVMVNNLFLDLGSTCASQRCRAGVREAGGTPIAVVNNVFVGYDDGSATCAYFPQAGCLSDVNDQRDALADDPYITGNADTLAGVTTVGANDYHLPANSPLRGLGYDTTLDDCRSLADVELTAPACGNVTTDRDSVARPTPPAVGAYEPL